MTLPPAPRGRGSHLNPPNPFTRLHREIDLEQVDEEDWQALLDPATRYILERADAIVTENDSPDLSFRYTVNPYRGCQHGCSYCYARPTHEYLGLNAGLDFETVIFVKENAPALFREFLLRPSWRPEVIVFSGVTDCYQPAERKYLLTRGCLEVAVEARQPVSIVTKNALVLRDLDLLRDLAADRLVHVSLGLTTLDGELARSMEPRTSIPAARLRAVEQLAQAGVPVRALLAPVIPGLNDHEIPAILKAAGEAGARSAAYVLLRLPGTVAPVFHEWLEREQPARLQRVEERIRDTRDGKINDPNFGRRMRGGGEMAGQIGKVFRLFAHRYGLDGALPDYDTHQFRPPRPASGQMWLF